MIKLETKRIGKEILSLLFILGVGAVLLLRQIGNSSLHNGGDSAHHLMDGVFIFLRGDLFNYLKRKEVWIALLISAILIRPLAIITLWLGKHNIAQSIGHEMDPTPFYMRFLENLRYYLFRLGSNQLSNPPFLNSSPVEAYQFTLPVLLMSLLGIIWTALKRDRKGIYFALCILSTGLFFGYLAARSSRYTIFWVPFFSLFAVLPLYYLRHSKGKRAVVTVLMAILVCYQVSQVYARVPAYAEGHEDAARYVLNKSSSPTVFFDGGDREAFFVYFMRALDPERSMYVLRGRKALSSSVFLQGYGRQTHAENRRDILDIFDCFGIEYVLVEKRKDFKTPRIHQVLRDLLRDGTNR